MPGIGIGLWVGKKRGGVTWTPQWNPANPLLRDSEGTVQNLRCVLLILGVYYCYEEDFSTVWEIRVRTSADGITWSAASGPLFARGNVGTFDRGGQADPTVIYDGPGDWKMWYDATPGSDANWTVGYATSTDGITWTQVGKVIDKGVSGQWDDNSIHHSVCIKNGTTYYLYYSGANTTDSTLFVKHIGLATSLDGINFTKLGIVIPSGSGSDWDKNYVRPSNPVKMYNAWYMWYWGNDITNHAMGLAVSKDLITWTKKGNVIANHSTASTALLRTGTDVKDKVIKLWVCDYENQSTKKRYMIPEVSIGTPISPFVYNQGFGILPTTAGAPVTKAANYIYLYRVTLAAISTPTTIRLFVKWYSVIGNIKAALYQNNVNTPTSLLKLTDEKAWSTIPANSWVVFNIISPTQLNAGDYWIAFFSSINYDTQRGAGGANNHGNLSLAYGAFPDPISAPTNQAFNIGDFALTGDMEFGYGVALASEPANVYFNGVKGVKKATGAEVVALYDWFWIGGYLYVKTNEDTDINYLITYD